MIEVPHSKWGEIPLGLVVLKDGKKVDVKEIEIFARDFIKKGILSRESMLLKITIVEQINKTSVGKIDKKTLREKYK